MVNDTALDKDEVFMREAIHLAELSVEHGNEPFGAMLVKDGKSVFTGENRIYSAHDPTWHAEAGLLRDFCRLTQITDLHEYTMYASCEPCFMCSGALVWTRLGRLVYGASNRDLEEILGKDGCDTSRIVFMHSPHYPKVRGGVLRKESIAVLSAYFKDHEKG